MLIITENGQLETLQRVVDQDYVLHLFNNNIYPMETTIFDNFSEIQGQGYFPINIVPKKWKIKRDEHTAVPIAIYPTQTFVFTGPVGDIYGYFLTRFNTKSVSFAERFDDGPYTIKNLGDYIEVNLGLRWKKN